MPHRNITLLHTGEGRDGQACCGNQRRPKFREMWRCADGLP
jgi:hypothetical protein